MSEGMVKRSLGATHYYLQYCVLWLWISAIGMGRIIWSWLAETRVGLWADLWRRLTRSWLPTFWRVGCWSMENQLVSVLMMGPGFTICSGHGVTAITSNLGKLLGCHFKFWHRNSRVGSFSRSQKSHKARTFWWLILRRYFYFCLITRSCNSLSWTEHLNFPPISVIKLF